MGGPRRRFVRGPSDHLARLLPLLAQRPLLGYGPDTLELVFPAVYPPELVYYQGRGILVDRAHNLLLDWARRPV